MVEEFSRRIKRYSMTNYLFLDNWVLSNYTKGEKLHSLSKFIQDNNYTIAIDSLSFVELYNPNWEAAGEDDRGIRAVNLLAQHPLVIVDPSRIWILELESFPSKVETLPTELNLDQLPFYHRAKTLLMFLRRDNIFVEMGKDITTWSANYDRLKREWPDNVNAIIDHALTIGYLKKENGVFINLSNLKEKFLRSLDARHLAEYFDNHNDHNLKIAMSDMAAGASNNLLSIRASSLYFWFSYIDIDKSFLPKRKGSDIGDYYQLSLLPYCTMFTTDITMSRLAQRVIREMNLASRVADYKMFQDEINKYA